MLAGRCPPIACASLPVRDHPPSPPPTTKSPQPSTTPPGHVAPTRSPRSTLLPHWSHCARDPPASAHRRDPRSAAAAAAQGSRTVDSWTRRLSTLRVGPLQRPASSLAPVTPRYTHRQAKAQTEHTASRFACISDVSLEAWTTCA